MATASWLIIVGWCVIHVARTYRDTYLARERLGLQTPHVERFDPSELPKAFRGARLQAAKLGIPEFDAIIDRRYRGLLVSILAAAAGWIPGAWLASVIKSDPLAWLPLALIVTFVVAVVSGSFLFRDSSLDPLVRFSPVRRRTFAWLIGSAAVGLVIASLISR